MGWPRDNRRQFHVTTLLHLIGFNTIVDSTRATRGQCLANLPIRSAYANGATIAFAGSHVRFYSLRYSSSAVLQSANRDDGQVLEGRYRVAAQLPPVGIEIDSARPQPMTNAAGFPAVDSRVFDPATSGLLLGESESLATFDIDLTLFSR